MAVETEENKGELSDKQEIEKLEREMNDAEYRRLKLEKARAEKAQREREEAARERAEQLEMNRAHEEALKEDEERGYNKSWKGKIANKLGRGKYQKKPSDEEGGKKQDKEGGTFGSTVLVTKQSDLATKLIIIFAYLIWIFDLLPFYGGTYTGYKFSFQIIRDTNWIAVSMSGFVVFALVINLFTEFFNKDSTFIISTVILGLLYTKPVLYVYEKSFTAQWLNLAFLAIGVIIVVYVMHKHGWNYGQSEFFTYCIMVFTMSFLWVNWGIVVFKAKLHVIFIAVFCGYLGLNPKVNKAKLYLFASLFLIADFFVYSIDFGVPIFSYLPFMVIISSFYAYHFTESKFALSNAFILLFLSVLALMFYPTSAEGAVQEAPLELREGSKGISGFLQEASNYFTRIGDKIEGRLEYATGGLYKSRVEKNQFEPLGVYLDKARAAQPRFYEEEKVTIWGTIKSRTLSDPVRVGFNCYRYDKDNKRIGIIGQGKVIEAGNDIIPKQPFTVYTFDEKDIECTFGERKLHPGANTVVISATYNFETNAYHKTYFMDKAKMRAIQRDKLDPLKESGVKEINPATVYTNGPVELGVSVQNLIPVSEPKSFEEEDEVKPVLGILIKNRDKITDKQGKAVGKWDGKIKQINELVVVLPQGLAIDDPSKCTPVKFKPIENVLDYCKNSCKSFSSASCSGKCSTLPDSDQEACFRNCAPSNDDKESMDKCEKDCDVLFKSDGEDNVVYNGYHLDMQDLQTKYKDEFKDIDRNREFRCRVKATQAVLANVPVTTRLIRIKARYDYLLEQSFSVSVEKSPINSQNIGQGNYQLSNNDIDGYLRSKGSPMAGTGQCIKDAEKNTGVPAVVILAVAGHESGFGSSSMANDLNNLFGITCQNNPYDGCLFPFKGQCCIDRPYEGKSRLMRKYMLPCDSINDFARLISQSSLYSRAMQSTNNPAQMILEIGDSGYPGQTEEVKKIWKAGVARLAQDAQIKVASLRATASAAS